MSAHKTRRLLYLERGGGFDNGNERVLSSVPRVA
jgi:hypothetical protein